MLRSLLKFLFLLFLLSSFEHVLANQNKKPKVLLISFDGFRWNYLQRTSTPNFDELINSGVKAKWIEDVYVSQTFPNHYTIATGMYEESHGIVANQFFDPVLNKSFSYVKPSSKDPEFYGGEPIWITNQKQGHHTGVYFWVGSEVKIAGEYPTVYHSYNKSVPWKERVDEVVDWLSNEPINGQHLDINLALLYFSQPDHFGHAYGPESVEVTEQIKRCDETVGYLIGKLKELDLYEDVDIIITSDHGMTSLSDDRKVVLYSQLDKNKVDRIINLGVATQIWPKDGELESVYKQLKKLGSHVSVYKKDEIPKLLHYSHNARISPIFVKLENGYWMVENENDTVPLKGSHGFDNHVMDMHPFFISHGPSFKSNYLSEPFSNIHIYSLICHILRIEPAKNDGSLEKIQHILKPENKYLYQYIFLCVLFGVAFLMMTVLLFIWKLLSDESRISENKNYKILLADSREDIP